MNLFVTYYLFLALSTVPAAGSFIYDNEKFIKNTEIVIIGTVHESTSSFNQDTLLNIFKKIKPDVILIESDTSYLTSDFKLKEDYEYMFPETAAITDYLKDNFVQIRPYDINGRDFFLDNVKRKSVESGFFNAIVNLYSNDQLDKKAKDMLNKISDMRSIAEEMSYSKLSYINSLEGSKKIDTINYYTYDGLKQLIEVTSELSEYKSYWKDEYDYWKKRNDTMINNILKFKDQFTGKKIIVLCGFAHKNILKNDLKRLSSEEDIEIKEYSDY